MPGDIIHLEQGDNIPADCRLIEAYDARVNNAAVTGESLPKAREAAASAADDLIDSKNLVLAGTSMVSGQAKAVVFATGMYTEIGKIAHLTQTAAEGVSPLRREIAHLSRLTAILAVLIGLSFFSLGWMIGIPFWKAFIFAIGIIVAMVPEGLLPTLTLALVLATQRMAKRNVLNPLPALGRGARIHDSHLHRQDRHADPEPHDSSAALPGRDFRFAGRVRTKASPRRSLPALLFDSPDVPRSEGNTA